MQPGGPFTEQAAGLGVPLPDAPVNPADQGAVEQAVSQAANAGQGATARTEQQSASRLQIQAPNYGARMTNQDFYPNQGIQESRSTPAGQWGNSPLFAPAPAKVAMAPLAARGNELARQQQDIDKAVQKIMNPELEKTAPPYEPALAKMWQESDAELHKKWTDFYGNERDAVRALSGENPIAAREYQKQIQDYNALASKYKNGYEKAVAYNTAREADIWTGDPETDRRAAAVERGLEGLNHRGVPQAAADVERFEHRLGMIEHLGSTEMGNVAKQAWAELDSLPERIKNGGGRYDVQQIVKTAEQFKEQLKKQTRAYWKGRIDPAESDAFIDSWLPDSELVKWKAYDPRPAKASGSGSGSDSKGPTYTVGVATTEARPAADYVPRGTDSPKMDSRLVIDVFDKVGDKNIPMAKRTFNVDGNDRELFAPQLQYDPENNQWVIKGRDMTAKEIASVREKVGDDDEAITNYVTSNNIGKLVSAPARNNTSKLEGYTGFRDPNMMIAEQMKARGYGDATPEMVAKALKDPTARQNLMNVLR